MSSSDNNDDNDNNGKDLEDVYVKHETNRLFTIKEWKL